MSVELEPCPHEGCIDGEVTYCDLPAPGVYAVEGAKSATVAVVTGGQPLLRSAEFVGYDWDLSTEFEVKWLHRLVPESSTTADGSKG